MASYNDLIAQKAQLEKQQAELERKIREVRQSERNAVIARIQALMQEHGLTAADLKPAARGRKPTAQPVRKVAPKYRDQAGNTWSGRGLQPKWLRAALAGGRKLQDFAV